MIYIITGNNEAHQVGNYEEDSNYNYCLLEEIQSPLMRNKGLCYNIYHNMDNVMDMIDEYEEDPDVLLKLEEVAYPSSVYTHILNKIERFYNNYMHPDIDEDDRRDLMVISTIYGPAKKNMFAYLKKEFNRKNIDVEIIDIYKMFNINTIEDLSSIVENRLGSEFIYPDDSVSFAYSVYRSLGIGDAT